MLNMGRPAAPPAREHPRSRSGVEVAARPVVAAPSPGTAGIRAPADSLARVLARAVGERGPAGPLLQRHAGKAAAEDLLNATRTTSTTTPPFARKLCDGPKLPDVLSIIGQAIEADTETAVRDIVFDALRSKMALRQSLTFAKAVQSPPDAERILRNWASGTGTYAFDIALPGLHDFMAQLFVLIATHHPGTAINELDLFHGHVVPTESPRDLVVLFHAKELPEEMVSAYQRPMWTKAGILDPKTPTFKQSSAVMHERNFLWALSTNSIWLLADPARAGAGADPKFATLIAPEGQMSQLGAQQKQFGTVTESSFGQDLMNVNYFPHQLSDQGAGTAAEAQLFFTPVGGWGVKMALENMFPEATPDEVAATYAETGESLARCKKILAAFSTLVVLGFNREQSRKAAVAADGDLDKAAEMAATTV